MSFWSKERLIREKEQGRNLVSPWNPSEIKYGAYELSLGPEVYISSYEEQAKKTHENGDHVAIPSGHFALLTSTQSVEIPENAVGLISIKAGYKFLGLINVSGFHVDPGFKGQLKFSVYNAGPNEVTLQVTDPVFLIWFADLDHSTRYTYDGGHQNQKGLHANDLNLISGEIASPGALSKRIDELQNKVTYFTWIAALIAVTSLKSCLPSTNLAKQVENPTNSVVALTNYIHVDELRSLIGNTISNDLGRPNLGSNGLAKPTTSISIPGETN